MSIEHRNATSEKLVHNKFVIDSVPRKKRTFDGQSRKSKKRKKKLERY